MKALALVDSPDHVCCRYRAHAFEPALARAGWSITYEGLPRGLLGRIGTLTGATSYDTVLVQRRLLPAWQLWLLRRSARRLVFDFDDAVLYRDSYDPRGPHSPRRFRRFAATMRAVDAVIAGNDFLAECARRAGARPERIQVIPTCLDPHDYQPSENTSRPEGLDLVWIGSSSTLKGLERQRPLWERVAAEVPGVRMRVICDRFPDLGALPVVPVPWSEATEAQDLAAGDVGVSWVPDDDWSRGKCGLKVLQYQAAGLPVLTNPVGVHTQMIQPGRNGWLPSSPEEWIECIRKLKEDVELRRRCGRAARASLEAGYAIAVWESAFVASIAGGAAVPGPMSLRASTATAERERSGARG
jgi:glycosyltransferase involved in cell wall biosynthesis